MLRKFAAAISWVFLWVFVAQAAAAPSCPPAASYVPAESSWFVRSLIACSARGSRDLLGLPVDPALPERELGRLAERLREELDSSGNGDRVVDAFRRVLLAEEGFTYDRATSDPRNYLLESVLVRKRGNCLGLSMLYLALSDRLGLSFRGVYVPSHCFVRYEGGGVRRNVEFSEGGVSWDDDRYRREFRLRPERPYLSSLTPSEMLGVFLKTLGAAYSRRGRQGEALRLYAEAERFFPGLPDVHYNAGISLQKLGRLDEAERAYRRAIGIDPWMAAPRDNLGVLLAKLGRFEEAIGEARRAVELDPWNVSTRGNLAATYCDCGRVEEAIREYRGAMEIDPEDPKILQGITRAYTVLGRMRKPEGSP